MASSKQKGGHGRKRRSVFRRRDYRAEYQRRIALAESRSQSRAVGRGHARAGERPKPAGPRLINPSLPEERAVKLIKEGKSLRAAAKTVGVTDERVRRHLKENTDATRNGRTWLVIDGRPRQFPIYSGGRLASPWLSPDEASRAAKFMAAVTVFLPSGDDGLLEPFVSMGVTDIRGRRFNFETDPNTLFELDAAGELNFPEIYKIVGGQIDG
jgi:hypothetical protein